MKILRATLALLLVYHLGIGLLSVASADLTAQFARWFYGTHIRIDPQFVYVLKMLGLYALFVAACLGLALTDPKRYRPVIIAVAGLQLMRAMSRLVFFDLLHAGLAVPWSRNLVNIGLLLLEAGLLIVFSRQLPVQPPKSGAQSPPSQRPE